VICWAWSGGIVLHEIRDNGAVCLGFHLGAQSGGKLARELHIATGMGHPGMAGDHRPLFLAHFEGGLRFLELSLQSLDALPMIFRARLAWPAARSFCINRGRGGECIAATIHGAISFLSRSQVPR
jgi:hypothetical protein